MAWHNTLLNRMHILLNRTYPKTPRLVQHYCCNPLENLSTAVVESIIQLARHTAPSYTPCSTMPCEAGSLCIAKPDHTPGPPLFVVVVVVVVFTLKTVLTSIQYPSLSYS